MKKALLVISLTFAFMSSVNASDDIFGELERQWGFEPMENLKLTGSDLEIRIWATGNTLTGFVLRRRSDRWSFFHLGQPKGRWLESFHGYEAAQVQPMCLADEIFPRLLEMGLMELKEPREKPVCEHTENAPCVERVSMGGGSLHYRIRSSAMMLNREFSQPGLPDFVAPEDDPWDYPSYRAGRIYRFVEQAVLGVHSVLFKPHTTPFQLPAMILIRDPGDFVMAYNVLEYESARTEGKLRYQQRFFSDDEQGFEAKRDLAPTDISRSWRGDDTELIGRVPGDGQFSLREQGDGYQAVLASWSPKSRFGPFELAVSSKKSFGDLTYSDLSSDFQAQPVGFHDGLECQRFRPLKLLTSPSQTLEVQVDSHKDNAPVLPELLRQRELVPVLDLSAPTYTRYWLSVDDASDYSINQRVTAQRVRYPAPKGSDKDVIQLIPVQPEAPSTEKIQRLP